MMKLPEGFLVSSLNCGIYPHKKDLGLIWFEHLYPVVGFFSRNVNVSYSLTVSRKNVGNIIKAIIVNSGNANCFTHKNGVKDTLKICESLAKVLKVKRNNILIASTGVIGKKLPFKQIEKCIPSLVSLLGKDIQGFAESITTTDRYPKIAYRDVGSGRKRGSILGIAKGAGMIFPNMATMLAFILTDIDIEPKLFRYFSQVAIEESFNSISVDGCMSTNDTVFIVSSKKVKIGSKHIDKFFKGLKDVCIDLAKMIVRDGEGATKVIEIRVEKAKNRKEAKLAASSVANSILFKTAMYGNVYNVGRIISALGQAGIKVGDRTKIKFSKLKNDYVRVNIHLQRGKAQAVFYTSDLTPEYVKLNADYN